MLHDKLNNTMVHKWEHIFYPTIPFTWILSSLTVIGSAFIIRYLMTKPMIAQTIMDFGNHTGVYMPIMYPSRQYGSFWAIGILIPEVELSRLLNFAHLQDVFRNRRLAWVFQVCQVKWHITGLFGGVELSLKPGTGKIPICCGHAARILFGKTLHLLGGGMW